MKKEEVYKIDKETIPIGSPFNKPPIYIIIKINLNNNSKKNIYYTQHKIKALKYLLKQEDQENIYYTIKPIRELHLNEEE